MPVSWRQSKASRGMAHSQGRLSGLVVANSLYNPARESDVKTNLMMRKNFAVIAHSLLVAKPRKAHSDTGEEG